MARLDLRTVWINAAIDGVWSDVIELVSTSGLQQTETSNMRVRNATGNRVLVTILPGGSSTWQIDCKLASIDEVIWLRRHRGQLLCFRDMHGQKVFGVYPEIPRNPYTNGEHFTVSLTVTQVEHSEAV